MKKRLTIALALVLCVSFSALGQAAAKAPVKFSGVENIMYIGRNYPLMVESSRAYTVDTSNKQILGLGRDKLTGGYYAIPRKTGIAKLMARVKQDGKVYKNIVTVRVKKPKLTYLKIPASLTLEKGEKQVLTPEVQPATITNPILAWSSSNTAVARVDSKGVVTGIAPGKAVITVKSGALYSKCAVSVQNSAAKKRAFLFGMSMGDSLYRDIEFDALTSVYAEVLSVRSLFEREGIQSSYFMNYTRDAILSSMDKWPSGVKSDDVTYIYYSGHGMKQGAKLYLLAGTDDAITAKELRRKLDMIPGKIVLMLNCCNAGSAIGKSVQDDALTSAFVSEFLSAGAKTSEFVNAKYTVVCSSRSTEYGLIVDGVDLFADALSDGLGWDLMSARSSGTWQADADKDGSVTVTELRVYMRDHVANAIRNSSDREMRQYTQTIVTYPTTSNAVLFG